VHVPVEVEDREAVEAWLSERAGRSVRVRTPKRGDRRALLDLASRNAGLAYDARYSEDARIHAGALTELQRVLGLPQPPVRVECFDISTFQGRETVGSMVVCDDGRMQRSEYRKFRVQGLDARGGRRGSRGKGHARRAAPEETGRRYGAGSAKADDFAAMHEVVLRRYRRLMEEGGPFPDLVVVDGGPGQVAAAYRALDTLGLGNLVVIGLAKREEEIYTRGGNAPLRLQKSSPALHLVQRARDEAHRFAVTFHRRARAMRDFQSELDLIPGIGPRWRRALLERFGSLANVRRATREELLPVVGPKLADVILAFFTRITTAPN